jgi:phenylpyruvate tautomerase PptA (4-oxalocrotonate tautomerase family)
MPIYFCTAAEGRLTSDQKTEIAKAITTIYSEETGAPRYLVQVIFNDITPGNHFIAGKVGSADQIWVRCDTRSGKTDSEKNKMIRRILQDVTKVCGADQDSVSVLLSETPYSNITEFGRIAPAAGEEAVWFSSLPDSLQQRLKALS